MKVLFVVNWYTPLGEKTLQAGVFHYEQSMALKEYVDIALYWPFEPKTSGIYKQVENGLLTYRTADNKNKFTWFIKTLHNFKKICEDFKPDLIHANVSYPAGFISLLVAKPKNIPVILTEHAPIEQMHMDNPIYKYIRYWVYLNTKKNICVSEDSRDRLKAFYPKADFDINYNAVIDPNSLDLDQHNYRKEGCVNCAIVAGFYDKNVKGYQYLLPAIKEANSNGGNIHLHICGGGKFEKFYKDFASELGINNDVTFYDACERKKVYSIVEQMDFCVSSSIYECSGVSVQEEMLLGKPILVTKSGGANSLTRPFTAIVVNRNSTEDLANGLLLMSEQYNKFDANKIKEYAYKNFEISNVTKKYMNIYKETLLNK